MSEELCNWLLEQNAFNAEYDTLLRASVSSQFSAFDNLDYKHNWNYLLKCASVLAHSKSANAQDIALRISQYALLKKDITTTQQKDSAEFILNILANRRAITLAKEKGLISESGNNSWHESFVGKVNWVKQEIAHSVWLDSGERLDVNVFQKSFWEALNKHQNLSISAPTSAGKSHIIKQWVLEKIAKGQGLTVIYMVPTRALIAEVESDFQKELSQEIKDSKVGVTSFPFIKTSEEKKPYIFVLTQERLQLLLQRKLKSIDVLIVDEAYKLADSGRGILLQHVIERTCVGNPAVKVIYISPLASNPEVLVRDDPLDYSGRFEDVTVNQNLIWANQIRGRKWTLDVCRENKVLSIGDVELSDNPTSLYQRKALLAFTLGQKGGSIIYVNGASDAEKISAQLCDLIGFDNPVDNDRLKDLRALCRKVIHKEYRLIEALKYGVAFHYGNMPLLIREEVEDLFREGIIRFLVCTSTLVEGVNLPCRNIFLYAPKRGSGNPMNASDFWNLAGRAGRWGKDFQGNIICIDPKSWPNPPPTKKGLSPIEKATEQIVYEKHDELIRFIGDGTPRDTASATQTRDLESMASYLAINYKTYGSINAIPWMRKVDQEKVEELENAVSSRLITEKIPEDIVEAHPGISPLAMESMLQYFEEYEKPYENLLAPYATDINAVGGFIAVFGRLFNRLTNEFGDADVSWGKKHIIQQALITVHWMQGRPIKRIIEERQKKMSNEDIHTTIRKVLELIESVARYKAPKYVSCYNDILKFFLEEKGEVELAQEIDDITLYLEMGVNTQTHLSLMNLGLSRTAAVEVKEYITSDNLTEGECVNWFANPRNNWKSRDLPEIVKREIERMLIIHSNR